jgi:putative glutamine amidotransferase
MSKIVGITDGRLYENYANWVAGDDNIELVRLGYRYDNLSELSRCDGLFMTGGEDVHPRFYNKPEYVTQFKLDDFDERRDGFELELLARWRDSIIPLLGVCRGLQIVNVFLGGTLIPDLPAFGKFNHAKKNGEPRYHKVLVDTNSELFTTMQIESGMITSMHHQSIDHIARELVTNAVTIDGVIEGVEWINPKDKPRILLVQWHPEVMKDSASPLTKRIRDRFVKNMEDY